MFWVYLAIASWTAFVGWHLLGALRRRSAERQARKALESLVDLSDIRERGKDREHWERMVEEAALERLGQALLRASPEEQAKWQQGVRDVRAKLEARVYCHKCKVYHVAYPKCPEEE